MSKTLTKLFILAKSFIFLASYLIASTGYYEYTMQQRTILTNEKIKEFEEDIKNNENIDIKDYLEEENIDYSNKITNLVYNISDSSNKLARKAIKYLFKKLGSLVEE